MVCAGDAGRAFRKGLIREGGMRHLLTMSLSEDSLVYPIKGLHVYERMGLLVVENHFLRRPRDARKKK